MTLPRPVSVDYHPLVVSISVSPVVSPRDSVWTRVPSRPSSARTDVDGFNNDTWTGGVRKPPVLVRSQDGRTRVDVSGSTLTPGSVETSETTDPSGGE